MKKNSISHIRHWEPRVPILQILNYMMDRYASWFHCWNDKTPRHRESGAVEGNTPLGHPSRFVKETPPIIAREKSQDKANPHPGTPHHFHGTAHHLHSPGTGVRSSNSKPLQFSCRNNQHGCKYVRTPDQVCHEETKAKAATKPVCADYISAEDTLNKLTRTR